MNGTDRYADWDAAYVLGALAPEQRHTFEEHLAGCPACRAAVGELAAMPGLLAQVSVAEALALDGDAPAPAPVAARPRRWWLTAAAAVVLLVVGGGLGFGLRVLTGPDQPSRLAFAAVVPTTITAVVDVVPEGSGTDLRVECQYGDPTTDPYADTRYAIWVIDKAGRATEVKPWTVKPDKVMHPSGRTTLSRSQLSAVEIRAVGSGATVLRAPL